MVLIALKVIILEVQLSVRVSFRLEWEMKNCSFWVGVHQSSSQAGGEIERLNRASCSTACTLMFILLSLLVIELSFMDHCSACVTSGAWGKLPPENPPDLSATASPLPCATKMTCYERGHFTEN